MPQQIFPSPLPFNLTCSGLWRIQFGRFSPASSSTNQGGPFFISPGNTWTFCPPSALPFFVIFPSSRTMHLSSISGFLLWARCAFFPLSPLWDFLGCFSPERFIIHLHFSVPPTPPESNNSPPPPPSGARIRFHVEGRDVNEPPVLVRAGFVCSPQSCELSVFPPHTSLRLLGFSTAPFPATFRSCINPRTERSVRPGRDEFARLFPPFSL